MRWSAGYLYIIILLIISYYILLYNSLLHIYYDITDNPFATTNGDNNIWLLWLKWCQWITNVDNYIYLTMTMVINGVIGYSGANESSKMFPGNPRPNCTVDTRGKIDRASCRISRATSTVSCRPLQYTDNSYAQFLFDITWYMFMWVVHKYLHIIFVYWSIFQHSR